MKRTLELDGQPVVVEWNPSETGEFTARLDGREVPVRVRRRSPLEMLLEVGGRTFRTLVSAEQGRALVCVEGESYEVTAARPAAAGARARRDDRAGGRVVSPMPGKVTRLLVQPGQTVTAQDGLLILEAMKMENEVRAPVAGTVVRVHVAAGQMVSPAQLLVEIE